MTALPCPVRADRLAHMAEEEAQERRDDALAQAARDLAEDRYWDAGRDGVRRFIADMSETQADRFAGWVAEAMMHDRVFAAGCGCMAVDMCRADARAQLERERSVALESTYEDSIA